MTQVISRKDARAAGRTRYFTGRPCGHGHVSDRDVSNYNCCECTALRCQAWYAVNREYWKAHKAAHYAANRTKICAVQKTYHARTKPSRRATALAYYKANRELFRVHSRNRHARKKAADGRHTAADIAAIAAAQGHLCAYCRTSLRRGKRHVDHILPLALGGSNHRQNLQLLCAGCNLAKHASHPIDYARKIGLLL